MNEMSLINFRIETETIEVRVYEYQLVLVPNVPVWNFYQLIWAWSFACNQMYMGGTEALLPYEQNDDTETPKAIELQKVNDCITFKVVELLRPTFKVAQPKEDPEYLEIASYEGKSCNIDHPIVGKVKTDEFSKWVGIELEKFLGSII